MSETARLRNRIAGLNARLSTLESNYVALEKRVALIENPPTPTYDADTQLGLTAAGITDETLAGHIDTFIISIKATSIWDKLKAMYLMVGGNAVSHAVNWKNPGVYNLIFSGSWGHNLTGIIPNGIDTVANCQLIPSANLASNHSHLSYYSRVNLANPDTVARDIGCYVTGANVFRMLIKYFDGDSYFEINGAGESSGVIAPNASGFFCSTRPDDTKYKTFRNGVSILDKLAPVTPRPSVAVYIGENFNGSVYPAIRDCAFASIGDNITDAEQVTFYNLVQTLQTNLGRAV